MNGAEEQKNDIRTALINKNITFSFLIKGWSGLVEFLLVPLTLHCLGEYKNGVWLTISSLLVWINQFDIGLGNGLRNKLATYLAIGKNLQARQVVSSTLVMLVLIILPVWLVLQIIIQFSDVYSFFNVDAAIVGNLRQIISVALLFVSSTFVFKFIGNVYQGLQLPAVNNLLVTAGQTLTLAGIYTAYLFGHATMLTIAAIYTASPLIVYLVSYPYTFFYKYKRLRPSFKLFKRDVIKEMMSIGIQFFLLQIAGVLLFWTSNILISKLLSPNMVTPYQIVYRYFTIILLFFSIVSTPFWSATTDAYARHDFQWIIQAQKRIRRIMGLITLLTLVMVAVSDFVYHVWIGSQTSIPLLLTVTVAIYVSVLTYSMSYSNFLNGFGVLRLQLYTTTVAAITYIPLTIIITSYYLNIYAIVGTMIAVNIPGLIINRLQFHRVVNKTAKGIWAK